MAPEAGTERLRRVVRKAITDEQLYHAADLLRRHGIPNLKCYFMIGLPTETLEDVEAIPDLAARLLERLQVPGPDGRPFGKLTLSVSSFVPEAVDPVSVGAVRRRRGALEAKLDVIKRGARRLSTVRVFHENPREAALQALLARGDRRVADFVELAARLGGDWRRALREWDGDAGPIHAARAAVDRDPALGPPRRGREEGGPPARVGAGARRRPRCRLESGRSVTCDAAGEGRGGKRRARGRGARGGGGRANARALQRGGRLPRHRQHVPASRWAARGRRPRGPIVSCPWHGWRWDVTTRGQRQQPRGARSAASPPRSTDGEVFVELP